jgi:ribosomal protein L40E
LSKKKSGAVCLGCGSRMAGKAQRCRRCGWTRPGAEASKAAGVPYPAPPGVIYKSASRKPLKVRRPPRPRCPSCRAKGGRTANACTRCGTPFSRVHAAIASKAATRYQAQWDPAVRAEIFAAASWDPVARQAWQAEADRARRAAGTGQEHAAQMIMKARGAGSLAEAWLAESDPRARQILRDVLDGRR